MAESDPLGFSNEIPLAGSVFVNNTTYTGCDIRILLHVYDSGDTIAQQIIDLSVDIDKAQNRLDTIEGRLSQIETSLASVKFGTSELSKLTREKNKLLSEAETTLDSLQAAQDRQDSLAKQKSDVTTKVLAEAQTLSMSSYRDKQAVRACGSVYPKGFTRGPRQIAGSLIFTVFNQHVLYEFLEADPSDFDGVRYTSAILDQLPPVDITIAYANEYGSISRMTIYGVEFLSEGQTMSIEDLLTENVVQYVARDYDPMRAVSQRSIDVNSAKFQSDSMKRASDLIFEEDFQAYKGQVNPFTRFKRRRNPFV